MQERMLSMFMLQQHLPIDIEGTMEKIGVPDYTVRHEKWKEEQLEDAEWKLEVEATLAKKREALGMGAPDEQGPGQGKGGGRPNSGKTAHGASMKGAKSGNVRVVNKTS
jgi:hypothetical protein